MLSKESISIIVVDDLKFSCEVIKSGLKKAGFVDIRTANSANNALILMNQSKADVVVADFWMPEMNGLELTDLIRLWDEKNNRYTGIILLTAEDTINSIVVAFDRGVDDFLSKSAHQLELSARVYNTGRGAWMQNQVRKINQELTSHYRHYSSLSLVDRDTDLGNKKHLKRTLESMINHCSTRGGGIGLALIQLNSSKVSEEGGPNILSKPTLRTVASSLQLAFRPLDQVVRFNKNTFAVVLTYSSNENFDPVILERCTSSILKHTQQISKQGKDLSISFATWYLDQFDEHHLPDVNSILELTESELAPL